MTTNNTGTRGAIGEYQASIWLMEQGYQVFRNMSPSEPIDIVAIKGTEIILIDVKVLTIQKKYWNINRKEAQKRLIKGIRTLFSTPEGFKWYEDLEKERPKKEVKDYHVPRITNYGVTITCSYCSKSFKRNKGRIKEKNFCSKRCSVVYKTYKVT